MLDDVVDNGSGGKMRIGLCKEPRPNGKTHPAGGTPRREEAAGSVAGIRDYSFCTRLLTVTQYSHLHRFKIHATAISRKDTHPLEDPDVMLKDTRKSSTGVWTTSPRRNVYLYAARSSRLFSLAVCRSIPRAARGDFGQMTYQPACLLRFSSRYIARYAPTGMP